MEIMGAMANADTAFEAAVQKFNSNTAAVAQSGYTVAARSRDAMECVARCSCQYAYDWQLAV